MEFGDDDIKEFQRLWEKEFGENITEDEARREARRLLNFYMILAGFPRP